MYHKILCDRGVIFLINAILTFKFELESWKMSFPDKIHSRLNTIQVQYVLPLTVQTSPLLCLLCFLVVLAKTFRNNPCRTRKRRFHQSRIKTLCLAIRLATLAQKCSLHFLLFFNQPPW